MISKHQPDTEETADEPKEEPTKTEWHLLFAVEQDLALTPVGVGVEAEFPVMKESPKVDLLLLRRTGDAWTEAQRARLPDGIRESTAINNLLEFKYTESLTVSAIIQALSYEHFFRITRRLRHADVRLFVLLRRHQTRVDLWIWDLRRQNCQVSWSVRTSMHAMLQCCY